jgi:hypothetical protein
LKPPWCRYLRPFELDHGTERVQIALRERPVVRRKRFRSVAHTRLKVGPQAPIRLLEFAPPECLFQPPSRQMPTDRLVRPLPLSGMGKEQGAADSALLLPKSS